MFMARAALTKNAWENNPTFWPGLSVMTVITVAWQLAGSNLLWPKKNSVCYSIIFVSSCPTMEWNNVWSDILISMHLFLHKKNYDAFLLYEKYKNECCTKTGKQNFLFINDLTSLCDINCKSFCIGKKSCAIELHTNIYHDNSI